MAIVQKQVGVAKEVDDIMVLIIEVVKNRQHKDNLADLLPSFMNAINGADQIGSELKLDRKAVLQTVGLRVAELTEAFLGD
jgi:hypothetical protein